jgi:hypothetical protein
MSQDAASPLSEWKSIPPLVRGLVEGRSDEDLDRRVEGAAMSPRETVHHIVEANVVAASIVIAALGSPGCVYDWSWMWPFGVWMERLRYDRKPIAPSLALLGALNDYVVAQVEPLADGLNRTVRLRADAAGEPETRTIGQVLIQEAEHAREHVGELLR